jgi:hypothetical protein
MSASLPIVLVHGAWHGAWCWAGLQHALDDLGVPVLRDRPARPRRLHQLRSPTLHGDAEHVAAVLRTLGTPAVLVGHSYGRCGHHRGRDAAPRGGAPRVPHRLRTGRRRERDEPAHLATPGPTSRSARRNRSPNDDGTSVVDATARPQPRSTADCSPAAVSAALARLSPQPMITFADAVTGSPRDHIPSTYVRCLRDQAIHLSAPGC